MLVDISSAANVLFRDMVIHMGIPDAKIWPYILPLIGFTRRSTNSSGTINILCILTARLGPLSSWLLMLYLLTMASSAYPYPINLKQPCLCTLTLEVWTTIGLLAIQGDLCTGQECFLATHAKVEHDAGNVVAREKAESSKKIQPQGEYDPFVVDVDYPERQVRVGKALPASIKHIVQKMLTEFGNIFFLDYRWPW